MVRPSSVTESSQHLAAQTSDVPQDVPLKTHAPPAKLAYPATSLHTRNAPPHVPLGIKIVADITNVRLRRPSPQQQQPPPRLQLPLMLVLEKVTVLSWVPNAVEIAEIVAVGHTLTHKGQRHAQILLPLPLRLLGVLVAPRVAQVPGPRELAKLHVNQERSATVQLVYAS